MARRHLTALALATVASIALAGCASTTGSDAGTPTDSAAGSELGTEANPVRLGVTGASEPYWKTYEEAVKAEGIQIELVDFTDYAQPNPALSEGEIDANQFQHLVYLADYNKNAGDDLTPIGSTAIYQLGLYSTKYESPEAIPDGETVIVPDDDTNQARGLLVLQAAGLVSLEDGGNSSSTVADVIEDQSRVKVSAVSADITATSLADAAAAIINNDFLANAGLTASDAIATDDPSDPVAAPYINVFATTAESADDPVLARIVEIYQTNEDVQAGVLEASGGTAQLVQTPKADLQAALADVQASLPE